MTLESGNSAVPVVESRRELTNEFDAARRELGEASEDWRLLERRLGLAERGKRLDGEVEVVVADAAERAVFRADLEGAKPEAARRLLDARERLTAARVALANFTLPSLVEKAEAGAAKTADLRARLDLLPTHLRDT